MIRPPFAPDFATDEDVALRASVDFALLCPKDQVIARGDDGVFRPGAPWTLTSASVDFASRGVIPGQVVGLQRIGSAIRPGGEALVVASVSTGSITLRRKGQPAGVGEPPGPASGLVGVGFSIATLGPQIALAADDAARRFGLEPGRSAAGPADARAIRDVVVLTVLHRQYLDNAREVGGSTGGDAFAAKAASARVELDDALGRLSLRGAGGSIGGDDGPITRFSTRMSR